MPNATELEAEIAAKKIELRNARKAENRAANARKRAGKALDRWQSKYADCLTVEDAAAITRLVESLSK